MQQNNASTIVCTAHNLQVEENQVLDTVVSTLSKVSNDTTVPDQSIPMLSGAFAADGNDSEFPAVAAELDATGDVQSNGPGEADLEYIKLATNAGKDRLYIAVKTANGFNLAKGVDYQIKFQPQANSEIRINFKSTGGANPQWEYNYRINDGNDQPLTGTTQYPNGNGSSGSIMEIEIPIGAGGSSLAPVTAANLQVMEMEVETQDSQGNDDDYDRLQPVKTFSLQ